MTDGEVVAIWVVLSFEMGLRDFIHGVWVEGHNIAGVFISGISSLIYFEIFKFYLILVQVT